MVDRPARAAAHYRIEFARGEFDFPLLADAGGNGAKQHVGEPFQARRERSQVEIAAQAADAAGNVETDPARRNDAAGLGIEGGDAADRKAVAPVRIGHGHGRADQAGQARHVGDLLQHLRVHAAQQFRVGVQTHRRARLAR